MRLPYYLFKPAELPLVPVQEYKRGQEQLPSSPRGGRDWIDTPYRQSFSIVRYLWLSASKCPSGGKERRQILLSICIFVLLEFTAQA